MLSLFLRGADADTVAADNWRRARADADEAHAYAMTSIAIDGAMARTNQQNQQVQILAALGSANFLTLKDLVGFNDPQKLATVRMMRSRLLDKLLDDCVSAGTIRIDPRFDAQWIQKTHYFLPSTPLKQRLPSKFPEATGLDGLQHLLKIEQWNETTIAIMRARFTASYQVIAQIVDLEDREKLEKIRYRISRKIDTELNTLLSNGAITSDPRHDSRWTAAYHYKA